MSLPKYEVITPKRRLPEVGEFFMLEDGKSVFKRISNQSGIRVFPNSTKCEPEPVFAVCETGCLTWHGKSDSLILLEPVGGSLKFQPKEGE